MAQMDGVKKYNAERRLEKQARMRDFADKIIAEYREGNIEKGIWGIAEQMGISLGTLNRWGSDPDWQDIAKEVKLARMLRLEEKIDRAIAQGVGLQWVSAYMGLLNRLDPVSQKLEHSGAIAQINVVSAVRIRPEEEEQPALPN